MNFHQTVLLILMLSLVLAGCSRGPGLAAQSTPAPAPTTDAASAHPLVGTRWRLAELNGRGPIEGSTATLDIGSDQVGGSAGCNSYGGSYTIDGNSLAIVDLVSTQMACLEPEGIAEQEATFLAALGTASTYHLSGGRLEIVDAAGDVTLVFVPLPEAPDAALEGPIWTLDTFVTAETAMSLLAGTTITAQFADGTVNGEAGCNQYTASYTLAGERLDIAAVTATRMACIEPEGVMEQEARYLDVLQNVTTYTIEGSTLTLGTEDGHQLVYRTTAAQE